MDLREKRCAPCEGGVDKMTPEQIATYIGLVPDWEARDNRLHRTFLFPDFLAAMRFLNRVAEVAEAEGHHPDFSVHYNRVEMTLWTHAIGGLSENDFILAAKIDNLL